MKVIILVAFILGIIIVIREREKSIKDKIDYLIGRWAKEIYIQEPKQREQTLNRMKDLTGPLTTIVCPDLSPEEKSNKQLMKETYELVLAWIREEEEEEEKE